MPRGPTPLPSLLQAHSRDAGCQRMRKAGRSKWNRGDADAASKALENLVRSCYGEGEEGWARYSLAHELERAGWLNLRMTLKEINALIDQALAGTLHEIAA